MRSEAKTQDYTELVSTKIGLKTMTKRFLLRGIPGQFMMAREIHEEEGHNVIEKEEEGGGQDGDGEEGLKLDR